MHVRKFLAIKDTLPETTGCISVIRHEGDFIANSVLSVYSGLVYIPAIQVYLSLVSVREIGGLRNIPDRLPNPRICDDVLASIL